MRITVNAWDPGYADTGDRVGDSSRAKLDVNVELSGMDWRPLGPPPASAAPPRVLLVDGVRRLDARIDIQTDEPTPFPGLCASYAAGVVVCQLDGDSPAARIAATKVERGLFSAAADGDVAAGRIAVYRGHRVNAEEPGDLVNAVQDRLSLLEVEVAELAEPGSRDLLVIDGSLRQRAHLMRAVGFVKSHQRRYLPDEQARVIDELKPGQRTPVFLLETPWRRHSWYLRLPGGGDGAWAGIARLECAADLDISDVMELADASAAVLPRLASSPHKDPRAPQNLTPIAGLERSLRAKLGDPRLLLRGLRAATASANSAPR